MSEELVNRFSDKVWYTRKARIQASERLRRADRLSKLAIFYYTSIILGLSTWSLTLPPEKHTSIPLITVIASVVLFGISIYVPSQRFSERANSLRECYVQLDELQMRVNILQECTQPQTVLERLELLQQEYNRLLLNVENHNQTDYIHALFNAHTKIDLQNWVKIVVHYFFFSVLYVVLFGAPIVLIILVARGVF